MIKHILSSITNFFNNFISLACVVTSNAVDGSSAIINFGFSANAIAITTLCLCPPESSNGYLVNGKSF